MTTLEPTSRELLQWQRQLREDFYHRRGEKPPTYAKPAVEFVDTSPTAPVRRPPPPRPSGPPPADTKRGMLLAWLIANGPSTTPQIAKALGDETGPLNVRLVKMEKRGYTKRTGRIVQSPNSRPYTEWRATGKLA